MTERLPVAKTYKLYIGGQFPRTESGRFVKLEASDEVINVCRASRKDFRNAVVVARKSFAGWSASSAYLRGQIVYRIAEVLEGRREQLIAELKKEGLESDAASRNVDEAIDCLIHFAGWSDKYQQVTGSVNPVASSHFCFSRPEAVGVVGALLPTGAGLLGIVSVLAPILVGGNAAVAIVEPEQALSAIALAEVIDASDVPAGVVNLLTGYGDELVPHMAKHMDVNTVVFGSGDGELFASAVEESAANVKRVVDVRDRDWSNPTANSLAAVSAFQEIKTTWHPVSS